MQPLASPPVLLIVDPAAGRLDGFVNRMTEAGWRVMMAEDIQQGEQIAEAALPDIVMIGHLWSGEPTADTFRWIDRYLNSPKQPMFVVTPRAHEADGAGMTDDLNRESRKEFEREYDVQQLVDGLNQLLGAVRKQPQKDLVMCHGLMIDRKRHLASIDGQTLNLTLSEFRILWTLAHRPGDVFSRIDLADACRGEHQSIQERTIDVHIKAIRHKLGNKSELVQTVRGVGYRLQPEATQVELNPSAQPPWQ